MRRLATMLMAAVLLGSFSIGTYFAANTEQSEPAERPILGPNADGGNCHAVNQIDSESAARLVVSGDITRPGSHEATLQSLSQIVIFPSRKWGGGKVTIPSGQASAWFAFEGLPEHTRPLAADSASGRQSAPELLTFRITALKGSIKSFSFPERMVTGQNTFEIIKEQSHVQVFGSSGTARISGDAQAWLTNRIFSGNSRARVRVTFWGTYNFKTRAVSLSRLEAHAHSPDSRK